MLVYLKRFSNFNVPFWVLYCTSELQVWLLLCTKYIFWTITSPRQEPQAFQRRLIFRSLVQLNMDKALGFQYKKCWNYLPKSCSADDSVIALEIEGFESHHLNMQKSEVWTIAMTNKFLSQHDFCAFHRTEVVIHQLHILYSVHMSQCYYQLCVVLDILDTDEKSKMNNTKSYRKHNCTVCTLHNSQRCTFKGTVSRDG